MKIYKSFIVIVITMSCFISCDTSEDKPPSEEQANNDYVEVIARDFNFEVADKIPSGWTTFEFKNKGHAEHFFLLNLLPDSISYESYVRQVTHPFEDVLDSLNTGMSKSEAINLLIENLPGWYFTLVKQMGGPGIIEAGKDTWVTLNLLPGTYAMECYIKEQGVFHTSLGMIKELTVSSDTTGAEPPEANLELTLTNYNIDSKGKINLGQNTVAVNFKQHPEAGLGNDVQLVKMEDSTDVDSVIAWLDWMNIKGLESPAPALFLGGAQEMPVGYTAYFTVDLEPGNYMWISESGGQQGMYKKFSVN